MRDEVARRQETNPDFPETICGTNVKTGGGYPIKVFHNFSISTALSSSRFAQQIAKADEFNRWGYDIYMPVNPIGHRRRLQATVRTIKAFCLESDTNSLDEQRDALKALRGYVAAAVYSGNKSIHMFVRLDRPVPNPGYLYDWRTVQKLRSGKSIVPDFNDIADQWIGFCGDHGLRLDTGACRDFSKLVRVPTFINAKTGKLVEMIHFDPTSWWSPSDPLVWNGSPRTSGSVSLSDGLVSLPSVYGSSGDDVVSGVVGVVGPSGASGREAVALEGSEERKRPITTMCLPPLPQDPKQSFLDHLDEYQKLKAEGIPCRHIRRSKHPVMFLAALVHGWDSNQLETEWRQVVSRNPHNIGCSEDKAVNEIAEAWGVVKDQPFKVWLPDCTKLPDLDKARIKHLKVNLERFTCPHVTNVAAIVSKALWDVVRTRPAPCVDGRAWISSRVLGDACRWMNYRKSLDWMEDNNILVVRSEYSAGVRSRSFFVNIPLILHLLGFTTPELVWSKAEFVYETSPWRLVA